MSGMVFALEKLGFMGLNPSFLEFQLRRSVQTWQKGANLAEGCKPGRRGAKGARSGYPPCTFAPLRRATTPANDRLLGGCGGLGRAEWVDDLAEEILREVGVAVAELLGQLARGHVKRAEQHVEKRERRGEVLVQAGFLRRVMPPMK